MKFYLFFFLVSLIGAELSSISLRIIRYDVSFMDASFYLGDIQSHLMNLGLVAFIVAVLYLNKGKIRRSEKRRVYRVVNAASLFYFFSIFLILLYAYLTSEVVPRLSLGSFLIGGALLSLLVIFFNIAFLFKYKTEKLT